jgi:hypothetical protein
MFDVLNEIHISLKFIKPKTTTVIAIAIFIQLQEIMTAKVYVLNEDTKKK